MFLTYLDVQDTIPILIYFFITILIAVIGGVIIIGIPLWLISKFIGRPKVDDEKKDDVAL
jgi:hypothetical protein